DLSGMRLTTSTCGYILPARSSKVLLERGTRCMVERIMETPVCCRVRLKPDPQGHQSDVGSSPDSVSDVVFCHRDEFYRHPGLHFIVDAFGAGVAVARVQAGAGQRGHHFVAAETAGTGFGFAALEDRGAEAAASVRGIDEERTDLRGIDFRI